MSVQELRGVRVLKAANDLDIGDHTISVGRIKIKKMNEGRIPIIGTGGVLTDTNKFTYSTSGSGGGSGSGSEIGLLTVPTLRVKEIAGNIDVKGYELRYMIEKMLSSFSYLYFLIFSFFWPTFFSISLILVSYLTFFPLLFSSNAVLRNAKLLDSSIAGMHLSVKSLTVPDLISGKKIMNKNKKDKMIIFCCFICSLIFYFCY